MASGTIKWTIAAMGREPGDIETDIELDTELMQALLEQGRIVVVKDEKPLDAPKAPAVPKKVDPKE